MPAYGETYGETWSVCGLWRDCGLWGDPIGRPAALCRGLYMQPPRRPAAPQGRRALPDSGHAARPRPDCGPGEGEAQAGRAGGGCGAVVAAARGRAGGRKGVLGERGGWAGWEVWVGWVTGGACAAP